MLKVTNKQISTLDDVDTEAAMLLAYLFDKSFGELNDLVMGALTTGLRSVHVEFNALTEKWTATVFINENGFIVHHVADAFCPADAIARVTAGMKKHGDYTPTATDRKEYQGIMLRYYLEAVEEPSDKPF